jgi:hypothetical protein
MAADNRFRITALLFALALILALAAHPAEAGKKKSGTYDEGTLVVAWFGEGADLEFREADEVDYLWVSDTFSMKDLEKRKLHFPDWPDVEFVGDDVDDRDDEDLALARRMNRLMPQYFHDAFDIGWDGRVETSFEEGDIEVTGRVVDCSTGNAAAKYIVGFGAGAGYTVIDLKMVDKESGELLMALHHSVVSGTNMSTTESKFSKWVGEFSEELGKTGLVEMYEDGKRRKK